MNRKKNGKFTWFILTNFYAMPREFSAFIRKYISSKHPNLFFYYCFLEIL